MWVSFEGINGVGKSYLAARVTSLLGCHLVSELTDRASGELPARVIAAMSGGGTFLRTGHPVTETLALLALKVREFERMGDQPGLVVEDRGVDTVAVYQALIMGGQDAGLALARGCADRILTTALHWRPLPDRTILLTDEVDVCIERYEARIGARLSASDRWLIVRAARLYEERAAREPDRFRVIDRRGLGEEELLARLCAVTTAPKAGS